MVSAEFVQELVRETTGLLGISNRILAESCGISPSTLENWRNNGLTRVIVNRSIYARFDSYMRRSQKVIARDHSGRKNVAVDAEVSREIVRLYGEWFEAAELALSEAGAEVISAQSTATQERSSHQNRLSSTDALTHFEAISVYANLIRWRDKSISRNPFESKTIGMERIRGAQEIYDELVLFAYNSILETQDRSLPVLLRTSGVLEVVNIGDQQFLLDKEVHEQTGGEMLPLHLDVRKDHKQIIFVQRIYNGLQRGNEDLAIRVFDNSIADKLHMTIDFTSVLAHGKFLQPPTAQYIALGESGRPVSTHNVMQGTIWSAFYEHPQPGSRLQMSWTLE